MTEKEKTQRQILDQYIKDMSGTVYNIGLSKKNPKIAILRRKNSWKKIPIKDIKQGIVNQTWKEINEHELSAFLKEDNAFIKELQGKMVKRIILAQLLMELDDELIPMYADDKRFKSILERSNKETERIAAKQYDSLYFEMEDKNMLHNCMNILDEMTTGIAKLPLLGILQVSEVIKDFISNPEKYKIEEFEFTKVD